MDIDDAMTRTISLDGSFEVVEHPDGDLDQGVVKLLGDVVMSGTEEDAYGGGDGDVIMSEKIGAEGRTGGFAAKVKEETTTDKSVDGEMEIEATSSVATPSSGDANLGTLKQAPSVPFAVQVEASEDPRISVGDRLEEGANAAESDEDIAVKSAFIVPSTVKTESYENTMASPAVKTDAVGTVLDSTPRDGVYAGQRNVPAEGGAGLLDKDYQDKALGLLIADAPEVVDVEADVNVLGTVILQSFFEEQPKCQGLCRDGISADIAPKVVTQETMREVHDRGNAPKTGGDVLLEDVGAQEKELVVVGTMVDLKSGSLKIMQKSQGVDCVSLVNDGFFVYDGDEDVISHISLEDDTFLEDIFSVSEEEQPRPESIMPSAGVLQHGGTVENIPAKFTGTVKEVNGVAEGPNAATMLEILPNAARCDVASDIELEASAKEEHAAGSANQPCTDDTHVMCDEKVQVFDNQAETGTKLEPLSRDIAIVSEQSTALKKDGEDVVMEKQDEASKEPTQEDGSKTAIFLKAYAEDAMKVPSQHNNGSQRSKTMTFEGELSMLHQYLTRWIEKYIDTTSIGHDGAAALRKALKASLAKLSSLSTGPSQVNSLKDALVEANIISKFSPDQNESFVMGEEDGHAFLERVVILANLVFQSLSEVRPVDLEKLLALLEQNARAGEIIEGKNVVLLIGVTGSGKTTTLHYLAGSKFQEDEVDGFEHWSPLEVPFDMNNSFGTKPGSKSVTKCVQCVEVRLPRTGFKEAEECLIICDSPGFDDSDGVEADIANGLGIVQAIRRAKSVKPVLVLSKEGMGSRFEGAANALSMTMKLFAPSTGSKPEMTLEPFAYLFTKYSKRDATRLHKQFRGKRRDMVNADTPKSTLIALIDDIIAKCDPEASVIDLGDSEGRLGLLSRLAKGTRIEDAASSASQFVSDRALDRLNCQLNLNVSSFVEAMTSGRIEAACHRLEQLRLLATFLPEAMKHLHQAETSAASFARKCKDVLEDCVEKCLTVGYTLPQLKANIHKLHEATQVFSDLDPILTGHMGLTGSNAQLSNTPLLLIAQKWLNEIVHVNHGNMNVLFESSAPEYMADRLKRLQLCCTTIPAFVSSEDASEIGGLYARGCNTLAEYMRYLLRYAEDEANKKSALNPKYLAQSLALAGNVSCGLASHARAEKVALEGKKRLCEIIAIVESDIKASVDKSVACARRASSTKSLRIALEMNTEYFVVAQEWLVKLGCNDDLLMQLHDVDHEWVKAYSIKVNDCFSSYIRCLVMRLEKEWTEMQTSEHGLDDDQSAAVFHLVTDVTIKVKSLRITSGLVYNTTDDYNTKLFLMHRAIHEHLNSFGRDMRDSLARAKYLAAQLRQKPLYMVLPYIVSSWETWDMLLERSKKKPKGNVIKRLIKVAELVFDNAFGDCEQGHSPLESLVDDVFRGVVLQAKKAMDGLSGLMGDRIEPSELILKRSHHVCNFVSLSSLFGGGSLLLRQLLFTANKNDQKCLPKGYFIQGASIVSRLIRELKHAVKQLSDNYQFSGMAAFLRAADAKQYFLIQVKAFANVVVTTERKTLRTSLAQLQESAMTLPSYKEFCEIASGSLARLQSKGTEVSFMHDIGAQSKNNDDLNAFYEGLCRLLCCAGNARLMSKHLGSSVQAVATQIQANIRAQYRSETNALINELRGLLNSFPRQKSTLPEVDRLRRNLQAVGLCFAGAIPELSSLAQKSLEKFEGWMECQLGHIEDKLLDACHNQDQFNSATQTLMQLKRAAVECSNWKAKINQTIDSVLNKISRKSSSGDQFLLSAGIAFQTMEGDDAQIALQILAEHKCFKGVMNSLFSSTTARQDFAYVINGIEPELSLDAKSSIKNLYSTFFYEYSAYVFDVITNLSSGGKDTIKHSLERFCEHAHQVAGDFTIPHSTQVASLAACAFAYWSLSDLDQAMIPTCETVAQVNLTGDWRKFFDALPQMKRPHPAQVLAILTLLNCEPSMEYRQLKNHIIQILTGEGKSVVLGVTSVVLALTGCEVCCVCYSSYLSGRDFKDFKGMFAHFGVEENVVYHQIGDACGSILGRDHCIYQLVNDFVNKKKIKKATKVKEKDDRIQVLLVDEVDVLFHAKLFGAAYCPTCKFQNEAIITLLKMIWQAKEDTRERTIPESVIRACLDEFDECYHPYIRAEIEMHILRVPHWNRRKYSVVNGKIGYKEFDGVSTQSSYSYESVFHYINENEKGNVTDREMTKHLALGLRGGEFSYAELPVMFDVILGLSGTINTLSSKEKSILRELYNIEDFSCVPSVYGENNLAFAKDSPRGKITTCTFCTWMLVEIEIV
jgi:hypothetical protein